MSDFEMSGALRGFTNLVFLEFHVEQTTGDCTLTLALGPRDATSNLRLRVEFFGVSCMTLKNLGGGLTQLLLLTVNDIRDRQLDRLNYEVSELEKATLFCLCREIAISH